MPSPNFGWASGLAEGLDPYVKMFMMQKMHEQELRQHGEQQLQLQREKMALEEGFREKTNAEAPAQIKAMVDALSGGGRHTVATPPTAPTPTTTQPAATPEIVPTPTTPTEAALPKMNAAPIGETTLPPTLPTEAAQPVAATTPAAARPSRVQQRQTQQAQPTQEAQPQQRAQPQYQLLNPIPSVSMTRSSKGEISSTISSMDPKHLANNNFVDLVERQNAPIQDAVQFLLKNGMIPDQTVVNSYGREHFMKIMSQVKSSVNTQQPDLPEGNKLLIASSIAGTLVGYEYAPTEIINALLANKVQMTPEMSMRVYGQFQTLDPKPWQVQQSMLEEKFDKANTDIDIAFAKTQNEYIAKNAPIPSRQQRLGRGQPSTMAAGPTETMASGEPIRIDPNLPAKDQAAIRAGMGVAPSKAQAQPEAAATQQPGMGAEAQTTYSRERAQRQAQFDSPTRMSPAQATEVLKTINVSRDIAGIAKVFDPELIGPMRGRADWLKAASGKLGVREQELRGQVQLASNSLIRLYAGLTQSIGEEKRQIAVLPGVNEAPEQFMAKYNSLVKQVYEQAIDTRKVMTSQLGGAQGLPPNLAEIETRLKDVYKESNRIANFFLLPEGSKRFGKSAQTGAPVYKTPKGDYVTLE